MNDYFVAYMNTGEYSKLSDETTIFEYHFENQKITDGNIKMTVNDFKGKAVSSGGKMLTALCAYGIETTALFDSDETDKNGSAGIGIPFGTVGRCIL